MSDLLLDLAIRGDDWPKPEILKFYAQPQNWAESTKNWPLSKNIIVFYPQDASTPQKVRLNFLTEKSVIAPKNFSALNRTFRHW